MKSITLNLLTIAVITTFTITTTNASIIIINGLAQGNNTDIPSTFGSNLAGDIAGVDTANGVTPDIGLTWAGKWETHNAFTWDHLDSSTGAGIDVLQIENAPSTLTFTVAPGFAVRINSLDIANATDQNVAAFAWTISINEAGGGPEVFTTTTPLMNAGDLENININFTGTTGTDYVLNFNNPTSQGRFGAIDNLSFNQVPEPSSLALLSLGGLALFLRHRK